VGDLAHLLRHSLRASAEDRVPLAQEWETTERALRIERARFGGRGRAGARTRPPAARRERGAPRDRAAPRGRSRPGLRLGRGERAPPRGRGRRPRDPAGGGRGDRARGSRSRGGERRRRGRAREHPRSTRALRRGRNAPHRQLIARRRARGSGPPNVGGPMRGTP
jgi:hypothetical protein